MLPWRWTQSWEALNSTERLKPEDFPTTRPKSGLLTAGEGGKKSQRRELEKGKLGWMKEVPGARALMCALSPMCAHVKLTQSNPVRALRTWLRAVRTGSWELPSWAGLMELQRLWKLDWQRNRGGQVRTRTLKLAGWIACSENQSTNTLPRILPGTECHNRTLERSTIQSKITWYTKDQENANNFQDKRQTSTNSKMT